MFKIQESRFNVIDLVFPVRHYLHILQLEQYDIGGFLRWWVKHPLARKTGRKKPLVWTGKTKIVASGAVLIVLVTAVVNLWLGMVSLAFPVVPIVVAEIFISPFVWVWKLWIRVETVRKIKLFKDRNNLLVIGISGSYGKTSVKEYLYQILKSKYRVVRTPESYNTMLGIAKVVDLEVDEQTQIFICEMGAYRRGEIMELCKMVDPDLAMLTGLNEQHLEKFGSLENEIEGESESVKYVLGKSGKAVVNIGNKYIKARWNEVAGVVEYGENAQSPMQQNIAGAKVMARVVGMGLNEIEEALTTIKQPKHRLSVIDRGEITIIDDAYSSNTDGFRAAIDYLGGFTGWKVVVTPGIVELGKESTRIHLELGKYMQGKVDQVILVGRSERTKNIEAGYGGKVEYVTEVLKAMDLVTRKPAVVLFENDLPDNY
jgi:UDP-N-acetylmuramoyl-tripeptide--D-alanyl-D-alanine ligase